MEEAAHCAVHSGIPAEYVCRCKNLLLCEMCKREHEKEPGHAPENCKEVGLAIMRQYIQDADGRLAKVLAKGLRNTLKELDAGILREINRFHESCMQTEEIRSMHKLDIEGRYVELYLYAKSMPAGGAKKNKATTGELNKHLLEMVGSASDGLNKVLSEIAAAARHKPIFAAYKENEVLVLKGEHYKKEEKVTSALRAADMSKFKAVYIHNWDSVGDRAASELAFQLRISPVSAVYIVGRDISDAGAKLLAQSAFHNKSLSAFCISGSKITDAGAGAVAEAVRNSHHALTALYLNGWEITDSGAQIAAEAVKDCPLSVLYLGGGRITDAGAKLVADAMKDRPLSAFYLWGGMISDVGATLVAETVKNCPLSAFFLGGNKVSDSGAKSVAETISAGCTSTLSAFFLWGGDISGAGAKKVADAVRGCPLLAAFYLDIKPISGEALAYILEDIAGINTMRSVNLSIGEVSEEQMGSCLDRLQQSEVGKRLKLRFLCDKDPAKSMCEKFAAERKGKFDEFKIVPFIGDLFISEIILECLSNSLLYAPRSLI